MRITTIGLDLAKHWFQVHGISDTRADIDRAMPLLLQKACVGGGGRTEKRAA
jgi:hypothetical protein